MKKFSGFTLIEVVVVVSVTALLASLGAYAVTKAVNGSRIKAADAELEMLATAVLQLAWDTGRWPNGAVRTEGVSGLNEIWDLSGSGLINGDGFGANWNGPYYEGNMVDPWWRDSSGRRHRKYFFDSDYRVDGKNRIVVGSFGPNGIGPNRYDSDNRYVFLDD